MGRKKMANIIAIVWDFDKTLVDGYMQDPIFEDNEVDSKTFWSEVEALPEKYNKEQKVKVNPETIYLNHFIKYAKEGKFTELNNSKLREYGRCLKYYPGIPEIFNETRKIIENNPEFKAHDIKLEHYIVSTGMAEIIRGSVIMDYVEEIWGCEFIEGEVGDNETPIISEVGYTIDNTTKTRALFEINKGVGRNGGVEVNTNLPEDLRRVHFTNMIYVADGPSDIPAFSVVNKNGGSTFAIYPKGNMEAMKQVEQMRKDGRIHMFAEADYTNEGTASMWLKNKITEYAEKIVAEDKKKINEYTEVDLPKHLND